MSVSVLVLLPACSRTAPSDTAVDLDVYVADVCSSLLAFNMEVDRLGSAYVSDVASIVSVPPWRRRLVQFLDDFVLAGNQLTKDLEAAGVPDTESGRQFSEDFRFGLDRARIALEDARDRVKASSIRDPVEFQTLVESVRDEARGSLDAIELALGEAPPQIDEAWSNSDCRDL